MLLLEPIPPRSSMMAREILTVWWIPTKSAPLLIKAPWPTLTCKKTIRFWRHPSSYDDESVLEQRTVLHIIIMALFYGQGLPTVPRTWQGVLGCASSKACPAVPACDGSGLRGSWMSSWIIIWSTGPQPRRQRTASDLLLHWVGDY